jgi:DNA-binding SARP family transcriptional activator
MQRCASMTRVRRATSGDMRLALLAYLALGMPATRRRERVLGLFWPECSGEQARHRLRQVLYVLRGELGRDALVASGREEIGLNPDRFWCDAVEFERALNGGAAVEAQALYRGRLCEDVFAPGAGIERWLERERERLQDRAMESAWRLSLVEEEVGNLAEAIRWAARALEMRPDEYRLRRLISLCGRTGDRLRALRTFARYERMLAEEYDLGLRKRRSA